MKRYLFVLLSLLPFIGNGQIITTWAGNGVAGNSGDSGQANVAKINYPIGSVFDKFGNYYFVTGTSGNSIRKISPSGIITKVVGTGLPGYTGDNGLAINAQLKNPQDVTVDSLGNLFIADAGNNCIRKVDISSGIITTIIGNGIAGFNGDGGQASLAQLSNPLAVCFDNLGNFYLSDASNNRVRKVSISGIINTVAGDGTPAHTGDGNLAINAQLSGPTGLCVDELGNIYIADNVRVRFVNSTTNIISTIAGGGMTIGDGGLATNAQVLATCVKLDEAGNLYISDKSNYRVRKVNSANIITTVAGDGIPGSLGDGGLASSAQLNYPTGLAIDSCGNLYISESHGFRIRKVAFNTNCTPTNIPTQTPLTFTLYPNPATSQITITCNTRLKDIHLLNTLGQVVTMVNAADKKAIINISSLPTGIYYVRITDENGQVRTEKIIKEQCDNCNPSLQRMMEEPE